MAKNEYGLPTDCGFCSCMAEGGTVGGVTDNMGNGAGGCGCGCGNGNSDNGSVGGVEQGGCPCGGNTPVDSLTLSYLYSPSQKFCMLYSAEDALKHGTLFEQLYKPMEVYGRE